MRLWGGRPVWLLTLVAVLVTMASVAPASARDKPGYGGELILIVAAEPPSFDALSE